MNNKFILTAFGKNRPGIVAGIAQIIFENGCNLEDSNMGRLADEFTLILLLSGKGDDLQDKLARDCKKLEVEQDVFVFIRPLNYHIPDIKKVNALHTISVEGVDHAGIVYKISSFLARHEINIETLVSEKKYSPNSGTALYSMKIKVDLPGSVPAKEIETGLESLAQDLHVEIHLD